MTRRITRVGTALKFLSTLFFETFPRPFALPKSSQSVNRSQLNKEFFIIIIYLIITLGLQLQWYYSKFNSIKYKIKGLCNDYYLQT